MKISRKDLVRIIREEAAKSTEKYDDDPALKGDQDELPDQLQKGIIDKAEEEKNESMIRITRKEFVKMLREEMHLAKKEPVALDADGLGAMIQDLVSDLADDEPQMMGGGGTAKMAKQQLQHIASNAQSLHDTLDDEDELPEWTQSKIAVAEAGIDAVYDHLSYKMQTEN